MIPLTHLPPITDVVRRLGGGEPRHGRITAFYREGDNYSVSLDDKKNVWFDHRDGVGGGVLDLVVRVLGGTRADALKWLSEHYGIPLETQTPAQRKKAIRANHKADVLAGEAADWARGMRLLLEQQYRDLLEAISGPDVEPSDEDHLWEMLERLGHAIYQLGGNDPKGTLSWYMQEQKDDSRRCALVREFGRADLEHADALCRMICQWLVDLDGSGSCAA